MLMTILHDDQPDIALKQKIVRTGMEIIGICNKSKMADQKLTDIIQDCGF